MNKQDAIQELLRQGTLPTKEKVEELISNAEPRANISSPNIDVIQNYKYEPKKITTQDFIVAYRQRYTNMKNILFQRVSSSNVVSINKLDIIGKERAALIATIKDIIELSTGTFRLVLEDLTGEVPAIISTKKKEVFESAKFLTYDETVALVGGGSKRAFFVDDIIWPDIPSRQIVNCPEDVSAVFISDMHIGSTEFLADNFQAFINWLKGEEGTFEQKQLAKRVKYVFICGDLVDGVGVYPKQENELLIHDIYKQYELLYFYLKQIPKDKCIIITPGNHDGVRLAEPQPAIYNDFLGPILDMPNVISLSNPALINIHKAEDYPGMKILIYHGMSFNYYIDEIEGIRNSGGYDNPTVVMEYLLKRRHLCPSHARIPKIPLRNDPLFISQVPDVFVTGHLHKSSVAKYKDTLLIASSCFQAKTSYMEKVGHHPEPCKIPVLDLKTRKVRIMDFT